MYHQLDTDQPTTRGRGKPALAKSIRMLSGILAATVAAAAASGQTFDVVTLFHGGAVSAVSALVQGLDGNLYGTTLGGGANGTGTVFKIDPNGNELRVLHSFTGSDGAYPAARLLATPDGFLYGTTSAGGAADFGTIFKVGTSGASFSVLHSFDAFDGAAPYAGLIQATDGNLYGTTSDRGNFSGGTIFKIDTNGTTLTTLHHFVAGLGAKPLAGLLQASDGQLYGTTYRGGGNDYGMVFKIDTAGRRTRPCTPFSARSAARERTPEAISSTEGTVTSTERPKAVALPFVTSSRPDTAPSSRSPSSMPRSRPSTALMAPTARAPMRVWSKARTATSMERRSPAASARSVLLGDCLQARCRGRDADDAASLRLLRHGWHASSCGSRPDHRWKPLWDDLRGRRKQLRHDLQGRHQRYRRSRPCTTSFATRARIPPASSRAPTASSTEPPSTAVPEPTGRFSGSTPAAPRSRPSTASTTKALLARASSWARMAASTERPGAAARGWGTIYRVDTDGTNFTIVHTFDGFEGAKPDVLDSGGGWLLLRNDRRRRRDRLRNDLQDRRRRHDSDDAARLRPERRRERRFAHHPGEPTGSSTEPPRGAARATASGIPAERSSGSTPTARISKPCTTFC